MPVKNYFLYVFIFFMFVKKYTSQYFFHISLNALNMDLLVREALINYCISISLEKINCLYMYLSVVLCLYIDHVYGNFSAYLSEPTTVCLQLSVELLKNIIKCKV